MDPITGIGLAASLITLVGLATDGCKTIHRLRSGFKHAPAHLQQLETDLNTLQALLTEIERTSRATGTAKLSSELQEVWQTSENRMRQDLQAFKEVVEELQGVPGASPSTRKLILSRIRCAISDDKVLRYRLAFKSHIQILNLVDSLLVQRQLVSLDTTLTHNALELKERIDVGFGLIGQEIEAIHKTLSGLQNLPNLDDLRLHQAVIHISDDLCPREEGVSEPPLNWIRSLLWLRFFLGSIEYKRQDYKWWKERRRAEHKIRIIAPPWLFHKVWECRSSQTILGWGINLQMYRILPRRSSLFQYVAQSDVASIRRTLSTRQAFVTDRYDNGARGTALHVSNLCSGMHLY